VYAEHTGDAAEVPLDPFAGGSVLMSGVNDRADALAVVALCGSQTT